MSEKGFGGSGNTTPGFMVLGAMGAANMQDCCGARHESVDENAPKTIQSDELISFCFSDRQISCSCEISDGVLNVSASGGNSSRRDGTRFCLRYSSCTTFLLGKLNSIIKKYDLARNNGYHCTVDGLPGGCGDSIKAEYKSGEKLYMNSNQTPTVDSGAAEEIYDAFHDDALKNGLDLNTAGSNVRLYDDADVKYLQGKWKGRHFGREIVLIFTGITVKIFVDGKMTDNCEYTIFEGCVRKNKLKEGRNKAQSEHDYEEFDGCSCMKKKNQFTLTGYFLKTSYSTCDLYKQDE